MDFYIGLNQILNKSKPDPGTDGVKRSKPV